MFSFCINFTAVLPGDRGPFPFAQESRGVVGGMAGVSGVEQMDLLKKSFRCTSRAMKLLWISETSCNVYLQEFMHRVFTQVTNFEKMAKVFSTSKAFHSQLNCILTCHLDLNQIAGHKGSLKA